MVKARRHCDGFTLVETLAAGVILALSGAVLSMAVKGSMRSLTLARDYQLAAELLVQAVIHAYQSIKQ